MSEVRILRVVVISASDVQAERDVVPSVIDYLNKCVAKDRGLRLEVYRWEADSYPGFHPEGRQALIDETLPIESCDLLICIFWKRFGTPVRDARSGTEHELHLAFNHWKAHGSPHIMTYFKKKTVYPTTSEEAEQLKQVLELENSLPDEVLFWKYKNKARFERLLREHITNFLLKKFPLASETRVSPATDPAQKLPDTADTPARDVVLFVEGSKAMRFDAKYRQRLRRALSSLLGISSSEVEIVSAREVKAAELTINLPAHAAERLLRAHQNGEPDLTRILNPLGVKIAGQATEPPEEMTDGASVDAACVVSIGDELRPRPRANDLSCPTRLGLVGPLAALRGPRLVYASLLLGAIVFTLLFMLMQNAPRHEVASDLATVLNPDAIESQSHGFNAGEMLTVTMPASIRYTRGSEFPERMRLSVSTAYVLFLLEVPLETEHASFEGHGRYAVSLIDSDGNSLFVIRGVECKRGKKIPVRVNKRMIPRGDYRLMLSRDTEAEPYYKDDEIDFMFRVVSNE